MKGKITISRSSDETIRFQIEDAASHITFFSGSMTPEAFGSAITGLSHQEIEFNVRGTQHIGKKRVTERRSVLCPLKTYDRDLLRQWLNENMEEEGWMIDDYLGSQNSIVREGGEVRLNYRVIKYVNQEETV